MLFPSHNPKTQIRKSVAFHRIGVLSVALWPDTNLQRFKLCVCVFCFITRIHQQPSSLAYDDMLVTMDGAEALSVRIAGAVLILFLDRLLIFDRCPIFDVMEITSHRQIQGVWLERNPSLDFGKKY